MSILAEDNLLHQNGISSHPDWVAMDIENIGKSFYNNDGVGVGLKEIKVKKLNTLLAKKYNEDIEDGGNEVKELCKEARSTEGLVNNDLRMKIWPRLLGLNKNSQDQDLPPIQTEDSNIEIGPNQSKLSSSRLSSDLIGFVLDDLNSIDLPPHRDEEQVKLDIDRSFTILSHINSLHNLQSESFTTIFSKSDVNELKKYLNNLIIKILRKYPQLNYYQGYHDIASIILLTCNIPGDELKINEELAFKFLEFITLNHLRDFMIKDIQLTVNHLRLIPTVLEAVEPNLFDILKHSSNSFITTNGKWYDYTFYPALSSILTWYSHDLNNLQQILIIWDFIISYNSMLVNIYIYVATLVHYKSDIYNQLEIFQTDIDLIDNVDLNSIDRDLLHSIISPTNLFSKINEFDLNKILKETAILLEKFPIDELSNANYTFDDWFKQYNKNSVLLTTSNFIFDNEKKLELFNDVKINLEEIIKLQDTQVLDQTTHEIFKHQYILQELEEEEGTMSNSITDLDSQGNSLSSSMSFHSSTSTLNLKLANTSMIFKKLFKTDSWKSSTTSDESEPKDIIPNKKNYLSTNILLNNIYGISFTIGFIGFLVHFLVIRNNESMNNYNIFKYFNLNPFKKFCTSIFNSDPMHSISNSVFKASGDLLNDVGIIFNNVRQVIEDSDLVHQGIAIGSVGIGNIRNTIYGFTS